MKLLFLIIFALFCQTSLWAKSTTILFLGDSLTEGLGVNEFQSFPRLIEKKLKDKNHNVFIINGGISGSTSASGVSRLNWHAKRNIDILVLELGANDGLRGLKITETEMNLKKIVNLAKNKKIKVVLLGLLMPPNYGKTYTQDFERMYRSIAKSEQIQFFPSLLQEVAGFPQYNQSDGIHPNAKGHELIALKLADFLEKNL